MAAKLRHLYHEKNRWGNRVWYVRIGHGKRTPIRERHGTDAFFAAYHAALAGAPAPQPPRAKSGTLNWLARQYMASPHWTKKLKASTRKQRHNILKHVLKGAGEIEIAKINRADIVAGRDRRVETPSQANGYLNVMRSIFQWAVKEKLMTSDPSEGVEGVPMPKSDGFTAWTETDIAAYTKRWPLGTREYVALMVILTTGARRGDATRLGPASIQGRRIRFSAEKNSVAVSLPVLPELEEAIAAGPIGKSTFIARLNGAPMVKEAFGTWFGENCRAAGLMNHNAHGLRKACTTRLTDAGAAEAELDAALGWTPGSGMSRVYTRGRDNERLADQAFSRTLKTSEGKSPENVN